MQLLMSLLCSSSDTLCVFVFALGHCLRGRQGGGLGVREGRLVESPSKGRISGRWKGVHAHVHVCVYFFVVVYCTGSPSFALSGCMGFFQGF